ncbi:zinc finger protein 541 [Pluvialis apricaria]
MPLEDVAAAPLVISVLVLVMTRNSQAGNEATENPSPDGKDLKESLHQKEPKSRTWPKSLFIPPPPAPEAQLGMGGGYQSNLRLPTFPVDRLLRGSFQRSPYTLLLLLSPLRDGSVVYYCAVPSLPSSSPLPYNFRHINIGSQFQAEIPNLQDRSHLEEEEEGASLVWKPWRDIATNPETQHRVTNLLNLACSNVVPGGGASLELALHCLHETQGNVLEALEMLLSGAPQRPESHPLADYHYTGLDSWTPLEERLFKEAFSVHKKDFHLIQKKIQTKTVSQCVEYYYTWKKRIGFVGSQAQVKEKKLKRNKDEVEEAEEKPEEETPSRAKGKYQEKADDL